MPRNKTPDGNTPAEKGGHARAAKLSADERKRIAVAAAEARWGRTLPVAEFDGVLRIGDMEFPCAVLSDGTRVLTETQFMKSMGIYRSGAVSVRRKGKVGARMPLSLAFQNLKPFVDKHFGDVHIKPHVFRTKSGSVAAGGIPAEAIPKICEVWIDADRAGVLGPRQRIIAAKADVVLRGLAHTGIIALVDDATGYTKFRPQLELQEILAKFVARELRPWVRRFPFEFYEKIYALKGWNFSGVTPNSPKPLEVGKITDDLVYKRLAPGVRKEIKERTPRTQKGYLRYKLHRWLTEDIGAPKLEKHVGIAMALMDVSGDWPTFMTNMDKVLPRFGKNYELALGEAKALTAGDETTPSGGASTEPAPPA